LHVSHFSDVVLFRRRSFCSDWGFGYEGIWLFSENASKKRLYQIAKTAIHNEQDHKSQYKKPKQADENFEQLKHQPQRNQSCQKNKKWVFK